MGTFKKMHFFLRRKLRKIMGSFLDWRAKREGKILVYYFDGLLNVGDLITPYIVEKMVGRKVAVVSKGKCPHLLAVGSIMHEASFNSYIWGSGFLSEEYMPSEIDPQKVFALRGRLSEKLARENFDVNVSNLPLGDPALLMPIFYLPEMTKKNKVAVVPHYVDYDRALSLLAGKEDVVVIDVRQDPEAFINELCACEYVLSSSLHGLILSDAYGVKNKWIVMGEGLLGGQFKFNDYYSTTSSKDEAPLFVYDAATLDGLIKDINQIASVKLSEVDANKLLECFPEKYVL